MRTIITFFLFTLCSVGLADDVIWVPFSKINPTQFTVGLLAVEAKREKVLDKFKDGKLEKYLLKKVAPAYLGPDGRYHIVDRHHTSRGLYESNLPVRSFPIEVVKDLSYLNMREFYSFLDSVNGLYLYQRGNGPLSPFNLPNYMWDLQDDPYRSLSWLAREEGAFEKVDVNFLEFLWADYLREHIILKDGSESELKKHLDEAIDLCHDKRASHLPGYKPKKAVSFETTIE